MKFFLQYFLSLNIFLPLVLTFFLGCSFDFTKNEIRIYKKLKQEKKYQLAVDSLNKIIRRSENKKFITYALSEKASLSLLHLKNPLQAIQSYKRLAIASENTKVKYEYQLIVARIYLENLSNYKLAIKEAKLIDVDNIDFMFAIEVKKLLARCYQQLKNYYQAIVELNKIIKLDHLPPKEKFELLLLKANIYQADKKYTEAIKIYKSLIKIFPDRSHKERLYINLVAGYEGLKDYQLAKDHLQKAKALHLEDKNYINGKLKALKKLLDNMPGANGLRR